MDLQFHSDARAEVNGLPILIYNQGQTVPTNIHKILLLEIGEHHFILPPLHDFMSSFIII